MGNQCVKANCIGGCPCDSSFCQETTTTAVTTTTTTTMAPVPKSVLVLNLEKSSNKPIVIDFEGKMIENNRQFSNFILGNFDDDLDFEYGVGTNTYRACGASLEGQMWIFGGSDKRQVRIL